MSSSSRPMSRGNSADLRRSRDRIDSEDRVHTTTVSTHHQTTEEDDFQSILASLIDEDYIINATGIKDISRIEYISLQIDTNQQSILDVPDLLPSLKHLVLDNSTIPSIRDLGVGLRHIASLSLSSCGLIELDGIGVLTGLQELNLSDNYISDLTPLTMHENLQNLNLSGNRIADISFGVVLASCPSLRSLFMTRNPIERVGQYRGVVSYMIPSLEMLDGTPIDAKDATKVTQGTLMDVSTTLSLIGEEMDDEERLEQEISGVVMSSNHSSSKDYASSSSSHRQTSANTNSMASTASNENIPDTGSELTHGSFVVLAGNVAAAMRKRRNHATSASAEGKVLSQKNSYNDLKKSLDGDFESPLDVLDSILTTKKQSQRGDDKSGRDYLVEGDITDSVMGLGSPVRSKSHRATDLNIETCMSPSYPRKSAPSSAMGNPGANSFDLDSTSLLSTTKRPKSAFSGTTYRYNADSPEKPAKDTDKHAPSPRQINSSRPQSAANPMLLGSIPLPFNVSVKAASRRSGANESSDDEDDDKPIDTSARRIVGRKTNASSPPLGSKSKNASIVHLDIVKRNKNDKADMVSKRLDLGQLEDLDESTAKDEEEDSDNEEIAITHSERLKMMSSSASYTAANMHRSRQSVLMKLQSRSSDVVNAFVEENIDIAAQRPPSAGKRPSVINGDNQWLGDKSGEATPRQGIAMLNSSLPTVGTASKAGISLGFNLAGSLAAIDQWVHDMSSEDDDEEDSLNHSGAQTQRGEHSDFIIEPVQTPRFGLQSNGNTASNPKILSRDAIFNMCSNSSNPRESKKYRELDPLYPTSGTSTARKDSKSSILSEDSQDSEMAHKPVEVKTHPIVQKAAAISSQKAALLSKVAGAKAISLIDPTQRNSADASFVVEEDKPVVPVKEKTKAPKPTPSYAAPTSSSRSGQATRALDMTDIELVELLRKPPKTISALRTKAGFQEFFRGIDVHRFNKLLQSAYQDIEDLTERDGKIKRRMELMDGVFV